MSTSDRKTVAISVLGDSPTLMLDGVELWGGKPHQNPAAYLRALGIYSTCPSHETFPRLVELARRSRPSARGGKSADDEPKPVAWRLALRTEWLKCKTKDFFVGEDDDRAKELWRAAVSHALPQRGDVATALGCGEVTAISNIEGTRRKWCIEIEVDSAQTREKAFAALSSGAEVTTRINAALAMIFNGLKVSRPDDQLYRSAAARCLIDGLCDQMGAMAAAADISDADTTCIECAVAWLEKRAPDLGSANLDTWRRWSHELSTERGRSQAPVTNGVRGDRGATRAIDVDDVFRLIIEPKNWPALRRAASELGVQPCVQDVPGRDAEGLPLYVPRSVDDELARALRGALESDSGLRIVVVEGPSASGKTRAVLRGLERCGQVHLLSAPRTCAGLDAWLDVAASAPDRCLDARASRAPTKPLPCALFLDQLERYAPAMGSPTSWLERLSAISRGRPKLPIVLVTTTGGSGVRPLDLPIAEMMGVTSDIVRDAVRQRAIADDRSSVVRMSRRGFDEPDALKSIAENYDEPDETAWVELAQRGEFVSALWAGPWLRRRYADGMSSNIAGETQMNVRGQAIAWAAMLLRQRGCAELPLSRGLLEETHLLRSGLATDRPTQSALDDAIAWATRTSAEGRACLVRALRIDDNDRYLAPAFLVSQLLDGEELATERIDRERIRTLLTEAGIKGDLVAEIDARLCGHVLQESGANVDQSADAREVTVPAETGTRGAHQAPDMAGPPGVDVRFDAASLQARLREADGRVAIIVRATGEGQDRFIRGLVVVVRRAADGSSIPPFVIVDRGAGPVWRVKTSVAAPRHSEGWTALARRLTLVPVGSVQ